MGVYEFRGRVVHVLQLAAALECLCARAATCLACQAARVLEEVAQTGLRVTRWRNDLERPAVVDVHVAGQVWNSREYRRSCPGYIVDRRQACALCGLQLVRGRWNRFFEPGERVWIQPDPPGLEYDHGPDLVGLPRYGFWMLERWPRPWVMCVGEGPT